MALQKNFFVATSDYGYGQTLRSAGSSVSTAGTPKYIPPEVDGFWSYDSIKRNVFAIGQMIIDLTNYIHGASLPEKSNNDTWDIDAVMNMAKSLKAFNPNDRPTFEQFLNSDYFKGPMYEPDQLYNKLNEAHVISETPPNSPPPSFNYAKSIINRKNI